MKRQEKIKAGNKVNHISASASVLLLGLLCLTLLHNTVSAQETSPAGLDADISAFAEPEILPVVPEKNANDNPQLREALMIREALEEENRELRQEVQRQEKELTELRSRYASLILKTRERIEKIERLELQAASLLGENENGDELQKESAELLALERSRLLTLTNRLDELEGKFNATMDILQASNTLREGVADSFQTVKEALNASLQPLLPQVREQVSSDCSVLALDNDLRVIVLDKGYLAGIRNGALLAYVHDEKTLAVVKVVESRPEESAAVLVEGTWELILPGVILVPQH